MAWLESQKIANCETCGWIWQSRKGKPSRCPNCSTSRWNQGNLEDRYEELLDSEQEEIGYNQARSAWKLLNKVQRRVTRLEKLDLDEKEEKELKEAEDLLIKLRELLIPERSSKQELELAKALEEMLGGD